VNIRIRRLALALAWRDFNRLGLLAPGVLKADLWALEAAQTTFAIGHPCFDVARKRENSFSFDGMNTSPSDNSEVASFPGSDAASEQRHGTSADIPGAHELYSKGPAVFRVERFSVC
jgi:hypothetical protein